MTDKCICGEEIYCNAGRCRVCSRWFATKHVINGNIVEENPCGTVDFKVPSPYYLEGIRKIDICRDCAKKYKEEFTTIRESMHKMDELRSMLLGTLKDILLQEKDKT